MVVTDPSHGEAGEASTEGEDKISQPATGMIVQSLYISFSGEKEQTILCD